MLPDRAERDLSNDVHIGILGDQIQKISDRNLPCFQKLAAFFSCQIFNTGTVSMNAPQSGLQSSLSQRQPTTSLTDLPAMTNLWQYAHINHCFIFRLHGRTFDLHT